MYSAELAVEPVPQESDGGGAGALIAGKVTFDPSYFHHYMRINAQVKVNRRHPQIPRRG